MNHLARFGFMAFLDLVTCGFGAAMLLFLISVTSMNSASAPIQDKTLLVRCQHISGAKAEVGIEYLSPNSQQWQRASNQEARSAFFAATSGPASGSEAFFMDFSPQHGTWRFRPYLVDFPDHKAAASNPTKVRISVLGNAYRAEELDVPLSMSTPGEYGQPLKVQVGGIIE